MNRGFPAESTPTTQLTAMVIQRLNLAGHYVWRNNTGRRGRVSYGEPGSGDVIGLTRTGLFIGVEIKAQTGDKLSDDQIKFREAIESRRGLFYECRAFEQFDAWCREHSL